MPLKIAKKNKLLSFEFSHGNGGLFQNICVDEQHATIHYDHLNQQTIFMGATSRLSNKKKQTHSYWTCLDGNLKSIAIVKSTTPKRLPQTTVQICHCNRQSICTVIKQLLMRSVRSHAGNQSCDQRSVLTEFVRVAWYVGEFARHARIEQP